MGVNMTGEGVNITGISKFQIMNILQIKNGRVEIRKENGSLVRTIGSG